MIFLKRVVFLLLACFIPTMLQAKSRILLITSLESPEHYHMLKKVLTFDWGLTVTSELEDVFRDKLEHDKDLEVAVVHNADLYKIEEALQDGRTRGVFIVSHMFATPEQEGAGGVGGICRIATVDAANAFDIFEALPPHVEFLALCGCYSKFMTDRLMKANAERAGGPLQMVGFTTTINAVSALKRAIRFFKAQYLRGDLEAFVRDHSDKLQGLVATDIKRRHGHSFLELGEAVETPADGVLHIHIPLQVTRDLRNSKADALLPAVKILGKEGLMTVLPHGEAGTLNTYHVTLPVTVKAPPMHGHQLEVGELLKGVAATDLKIVVDSGLPAELSGFSRLDLGEFEFKATPDLGHWQLYCDRQGRPIGGGQHIYRFHAGLPNAQPSYQEALQKPKGP